MHPSKTPSTSHGRDRHRIALVVVPDAVPMEVLIARQVFVDGPRPTARATGGTAAHYEVVLCAESERYSLAQGVDLGRFAPLETLTTADTVIVPGVDDPLAPRGDALLARLRAAHDAGSRMVSFCGGAFLLGQAGILDGRRATTHWLYSEEFRRSFPRAMLEPEHLYVDDGPVHTSGGIFSATDLALHLIALDLGQAYANDLGRLLVAAPHRQGGQSQYFKDSLRAGGEPPVAAFLHWLRDHLHEPLTLSRLAAQEHMSERSLIRKFRRDMGMSVFDWISQERVSRAKALLETTDHRVGEIASLVGFGSAESLRRNFEKNVGLSTTAYRKAFRGESATGPGFGDPRGNARTRRGGPRSV